MVQSYGKYFIFPNVFRVIICHSVFVLQNTDYSTEKTHGKNHSSFSREVQITISYKKLASYCNYSYICSRIAMFNKY